MIGIAALALMGLMAGAGAGGKDDCPGPTTLEINNCMARELDRAQAELHRYVMAAGKRLRQEDQAVAVGGFDKAETSWTAYRDTECDAVYAYWSEGTIRNAMELGCKIKLTREHTHAIWRLWLTYPDSTPAILPEPRVVPDR